MKVPAVDVDRGQGELDADWNEGLGALLESLDQVTPLRGQSSLRRLVASAESISDLLELSSSTPSLEHLPSMQEALLELSDHSSTLSRLLELSDLCEVMKPLSRALESVLSHRVALEFAVCGDLESALELPTW